MQRTKQLSLVVAAVSSAAKKVGGAYVFASRSRDVITAKDGTKYASGKVIAQHVFAKHTCTDCKTEFAAVTASTPFCVLCGSENVRRGEVSKLRIHPDVELNSVNCGTCNTYNVMHQSIPVAAKSQLHCVTCGTGLVASHAVTADEDATDDQDEEVKAEDMETLDLDDDSSDAEEANDPGDQPGNPNPDKTDAPVTNDGGNGSRGNPTGEEPDIKAGPATEVQEGAPEDGEEDAPDEEEAGPEDNFGGKKAPPFGKKDGDDAKEEDADSAVSPGDAADGVGNLTDEAPGEVQMADGGEMMPETLVDDSEMETVEMMDMVDDTNIEDLSLVNMASTVHLAAGPYIIASLTEKNAGKNADIFQTAEFQTAIIASLQKDGIKKTLAAFNFTPVTVKARIKAHVEKIVAKKMAKQAAGLEAAKRALKADFKQSIDIASVGLNKNFWKDSTNPLKTALVAELQAQGVQRAEKLVSAVFEKHGLEYTSTLLATCDKIMSKTPELRNEIAGVLDMTGILASEDSGGSDEDDESDDETAALRPLPESEGRRLKDEKAREQSSHSSTRKSRVMEIAGSEPLFS